MKSTAKQGASVSEPFLPYTVPSIEQEDLDAVEAVLRSRMLTGGPAVTAFENAFKDLTDCEFAIGCSSGTAALHLIAMALSIDAACSVVVPAITFLATANTFRINGAEILFADLEPDSGLVTPGTVAEAVARASKPVRVISLVHLGGRLADVEGIAAIAAQHNAIVIEDACHAIGTDDVAYGGKVGSCPNSLASCFSLHPTKTITAGEGGVITTNDPVLAAEVGRLRNHGMHREPPFVDEELALDPRSGQPNPWFYEMTHCGLNYRISDLHAALALAQTRRITAFAKARHRIRTAYDERLVGVPYLHLLAPGRGETMVDHLYQVAIDFDRAGTSRAQFMWSLRERGIGTQVHYTPLHRQPYYAAMNEGLQLPGADEFYRTTLSLPYHQGMTERDVDRVVSAVAGLLSQ